MLSAVRWIGCVLATIAVIVIVVFVAYRVRGPSQAQRDAIALMEKSTRPDQGTNAFPLLWFMRYDVPDDQIEARMAADVATVRQHLAESDAQMSTYEPPLQKLPEAGNDPKSLCETREAGCLAKVAADIDGARRSIAEFPRMLAREAAFEQTDFYWNEFPADFRALLWAYPGNAQRVWLTAYAAKYVGGDREGALADVCLNLGTWRRLHAHNNSLLGAMLAISHADSDLHLFADMLAALPANDPVPDACAQALRPIVAADVDRCGEISGEFRFSQNYIDHAAAHPNGNAWDRAGQWVTYEPNQIEGWRAEQFAEFCGDHAIERMLGDVAARSDDLVPTTRRLECIASVGGCIDSQIGWPAYMGYDERTLDYAAHLRLAASLLWLRAQADPASAYDRRPAALRSGHRRSGFDAKRGSIFVDNMYAQRDAVFELPVRSNDSTETRAQSNNGSSMKP